MGDSFELSDEIQVELKEEEKSFDDRIAAILDKLKKQEEKNESRIK